MTINAFKSVSGLLSAARGEQERDQDGADDLKVDASRRPPSRSAPEGSNAGVTGSTRTAPKVSRSNNSTARAAAPILIPAGSTFVAYA